jgi:hypothetical protein
MTATATSLGYLRKAIGGSPVTLGRPEELLGTDGVHELRRSYFPRWRRSRPHSADGSLRSFKEITVEDEFEGRVVSALAPPELSVRVQVSKPPAGATAVVDSPSMAGNLS